jgi:hypothetical protein
VRYANDRAVGHVRVLVQCGLDLDGIDVLPAADDHVLGAINDVDEAFFVNSGDVS